MGDVNVNPRRHVVGINK